MASSSNPFTMKLDRESEKRFLAGYSESAVTHILGEAAKAGGNDAKRVLQGAAPIGVSKRLSQTYRRMGWPHGTFRKSVRAALIRGRGSMIKGLQGKTIGYVVGPMGKAGFTRAWIESGTARGERANPWVEHVASQAFSAALGASEAVLTLYAEASDHG